MKEIKISVIKYLFIGILIVVLSILTTRFYVNLYKVPVYNIDKGSVKIKNNLSNIDNCIFQLYNAENSFRMYLASGDNNYYKDFVREINTVTEIVEALHKNNLNEQSISEESFNDLIKQKQLRTQQFIQIKKLSDSLIHFSLLGIQNKDRDLPLLNNFTPLPAYSFVQIDTVQLAMSPTPKKKFFKRLLDAITNNDEIEPKIAKAKVVKTISESEQKLFTAELNKNRALEFDNYYQKINEATAALRQKELSLLDVNHKLILSILETLEEYKQNEMEYYTSVVEMVNVSTFEVIKNLDKLSLILLIVIGFLTVILLIAIFKLYKKEIFLITHSNKVAQYAEAKGVFLANMSHEIRTPLNSIIGFSEQLSQSILPRKEYEQVKAISSSSKILLDIVNDILDYSKYGNGKYRFEKQAFYLNQTVQELFFGMAIHAEKKKIGFKLENNISERKYVMGDQHRFKQVVLNLLSNAIKFTEKGTVCLKIYSVNLGNNKLMLNVEVYDTGIGIEEKNFKLIFEEFEQVQASSTNIPHKGTGLGLAICKKIIELQDGELGVKSKIGEGSMFYFKLPFEVVEKPINEIDLNISIQNIDLLIEKKILLVDDNHLNILLATTILKKYNATYDIAYNGVEAYKLFQQNDYHLVLTDIHMPEMGGIELTSLIRSHQDMHKSKVSIIGITANVFEDDRKFYLETGINDLVIKPFIEEEFINKIVNHL